MYGIPSSPGAVSLEVLSMFFSSLILMDKFISDWRSVLLKLMFLSLPARCFLKASLLFLPFDMFWKCLPNSLAMSFFWSTILFSPIFSPDICLFLFFPFIACILDQTSFEEVKQFMDSKNLFQWSCLLCLIVLTDIAFARLYSALFAVLGVRCTFRYALFLFLTASLQAEFHHGFGGLSGPILILPIAFSPARFMVSTM